MRNLYQIIGDSASQYPERLALVYGENRIQYDKIGEATNRLAQGFVKLGLKKRDRVAVMLPNVPHFTISYFALLQIGVIVVPISIYYHSEEIKRYLLDSGARGIIYWEKWRSQVQQATQEISLCDKLIVLGEKAEPGEYRLTYLMEICEPFSEVVQNKVDDTAIIAYTAGTIEPSKGVELTYDNIISNVNSCCEFFNLDPEDSVLGVLPFYHLFGQTLVMNSFLHVGAKIVLTTNFEPVSVLNMIEKEKPSYFVGFPAFFQNMLITHKNDQDNFQSIKFCLSVGGKLQQHTMDAFEKEFKVSILEGYGLTEASPLVSFNRENAEKKAGSIGLPMPGIEMKIVDDNNTEVRAGEIGEIVIQGPNVMKGYLNQPEKTDLVIKNGWLWTGDLAILHDNGFGFITVQKNNIIVKSGFHIYPSEIETLLCEHPKIKDAVVIGVSSDDEKEQEIHAYVLIEEGEEVTLEEIIQYSNEHMPAYKCPQMIHFISGFQTGPTGRVVRERIGEYIIRN